MKFLPLDLGDRLRAAAGREREADFSTQPRKQKHSPLHNTNRNTHENL